MVILSSPGYAIKKGISLREAETYLAALRECGVKGELQEESQPLAIDLPDISQTAAASNQIVQPSSSEKDELIRRLADYEKISGFLWLALGIIQVLSVFAIIAGIWNLVICSTRFKMAGRIRRREASVPTDYEGVALLVILGVINLFFGGVIGVLFVAFDFFVRDKVLSNKHLFDYVDTQKIAATVASRPDAGFSFREPMSFPKGSALYDANGIRLVVLPDYSVVADSDGIPLVYESAADYRTRTGDRSDWTMVKEW
jgi:hypothetical protein